MEDVIETLRQVVEGADFTPPRNLLSTVSARTACLIPEAFPYSIATNVCHTDIWNEVWLARVKGLPKVNPFPDFPEVQPKQWPELRARFLYNLDEALSIASANQFIHGHRSDAAAGKLLQKIAVHTAYHLGQINLMKRVIRARGNPNH